MTRYVDEVMVWQGRVTDTFLFSCEEFDALCNEIKQLRKDKQTLMAYPIISYNRGVQDCLKLLAKWFFMSNKDAKQCRDEMIRLLKSPK